MHHCTQRQPINLEPSNYSFPKAEKLCKHKYIQQLFAEGDSVQSYPLRLVFTPIPTLEVPFQMLVSVPKRSFKRAVHRNRLKRLIRECYRLQKHTLSTITSEPYALAFVYIGKEIADYPLIYQKVTRCFEKFQAKLKGEAIIEPTEE